MARWKRKELEQAFDTYQAAALKGAQTNALDALEQLIGKLKTGAIVNDSQAIEVHDYPFVHSQIEAALDSIDITNLLNPMMLNTGGMEILATLKRDLAKEIETTLFTPKN